MPLKSYLNIQILVKNKNKCFDFEWADKDLLQFIRTWWEWISALTLL